MEGNHGMAPKITIDPAARGGAVREVKQRASKEPTTPGTPSAAVYSGGGDGGKGAGSDGAAALPGWKLDCLCSESGLPPLMKGGFLCF